MGDIYTNSMLKDWHQCRRKYYYKYEKNIVIPKKEDNFELGKKVHALISYKLNGFETTLLEKTASEDVLKHYKSLLKSNLLSLPSVLVEWGFSTAIGQSADRFLGRIDAVFYDEINKKYIIADWKTGMNIPKIPLVDIQAQIYCYAFYKCRRDLKLDISPENIIFKFIQTPSLQETVLEFSAELLERFEIEFLNAISEIKTYKFNDIPQENPSCKFCEYKFLCFKN